MRASSTGPRKRARIEFSSAAYNGKFREEVETEAFSVVDAERNLVMEITPCPRLGIAHVVTMTEDQARRVSEYQNARSRMLRELGQTRLLLDITYVPTGSWNPENLRTIPGGSAIFPVLEAKTVPIKMVKPLLSQLKTGSN